jgi:hypothetical protein
LASSASALSLVHSVLYRRICFPLIRAVKKKPQRIAAEVVDAAGEILADVDLAVRVGDLVHDLHPWHQVQALFSVPHAADCTARHGVGSRAEPPTTKWAMPTGKKFARQSRAA